VLAKDLGWKLLGLVLLKEVYDLAACALDGVRGRSARKGGGLADFAAARGLGPEELARLEAMLE
jgi:hypothetical protein